MATAYNTSIRLYTGVPLVKGGTEVLYLSQSAAEGALSAFLQAEYTEYYFVRDNRRAVQIDAPFGSCDDVNYISFKNQSHGGKIFFAFVDKVIYINDNCTQIEFTIDPFPTYLGDTRRTKEFFVVRNTPRNDVRGNNLTNDYMPQSAKIEYKRLTSISAICDSARVLFACKTQHGPYLTAPDEYNTGIQIANLTDAVLKSILDDGGTIIGAYMEPAGWTNKIAVPQPDLTVQPFADLSVRHEKLKTGVYNQITLVTSNGVKSFEIEQFDNPSSITFKVVVFRIPVFTIFIYPANYNGVQDNTAEGLSMTAPALPISAAQGYTNAQLTSDLIGAATSGVSSGLAGAAAGAASGAMYGGIYGAAIGAAAGLLAGGASMAKNAYMSKFKTPQVSSGGMPVLASDNGLYATVIVTRPSQLDRNKIDNYFDYFGYACNYMITKQGASFGQLDLEDGAYLQTGSEFLQGSEMDDEINTRIMNGIKIRKTLERGD